MLPSAATFDNSSKCMLDLCFARGYDAALETRSKSESDLRGMRVCRRAICAWA